MSLPKIVFIAMRRTPFGSFGGSLKDLTATDLAVHAGQQIFKENPLAKELVDHVVIGNVMQTSSDAAYLARHVALRLGLGLTVPAVTTNRLCGSGFESIADGARRLVLGEAKLVLAGGAESMSQAPYVLRNSRFGHKLGNAEMEDSLTTGLFDSYAKLPMALTAEKLATQYQISRKMSDEYAYQSQKKAGKATQEKIFNDEIVPIELGSRSKVGVLGVDEHIRMDISLEGLEKLRPVFQKDGVITAGNASGMVDGAALCLLATEEFAKKQGFAVLGEYLGSSVVGVDPTIMGMGPVPSVREILKKNSSEISNIDLFEINEAFAPQVMVCQKELGIPESKLNVHGGAIAIGHPLGASGTRLVSHLLISLRKRGGGTGIASACIGGGQGMAIHVRVS